MRLQEDSAFSNRDQNSNNSDTFSSSNDDGGSGVIFFRELRSQCGIET